MLDHYVTLGRSGLRVSPLCLGTMTFGQDLGWGADPETCRGLFDHYVASGGNFVDTANCYTFGHAEAMIGEFVTGSSSRRDALVLATKFAMNLYAGDPNGGGASRKAIMQQCENSLRRLGTDYIDLYWIHCWDEFTPIEETMLALDNLVRSGKVRYIGFSDAPAWKVAQSQTLALMRGWSPLIALQVPYSLLQRSVEAEFLPMAKDLGLGVLPWAPLAGGALSGKYDREKPLSSSDRGELGYSFGEREWNLIEAMREIAGRRETTVSTIALSWVVGQPMVTSPIIGVRIMPQLLDNIAALGVKLTDDERRELDELTSPHLPFPNALLKSTPSLMHAGATVNGVSSVLRAITPGRDEQRH